MFFAEHQTFYLMQLLRLDLLRLSSLFLMCCLFCFLNLATVGFFSLDVFCRTSNLLPNAATSLGLAPAFFALSNVLSFLLAKSSNRWIFLFRCFLQNIKPFT